MLTRPWVLSSRFAPAPLDLGIRKPHPEMYRRVVGQLGVPARSCLYVGDGNSNELLGAREQGMTTVWVDNGDQQAFKERSGTPRRPFGARALAELLPLVDRLSG